MRAATALAPAPHPSPSDRLVDAFVAVYRRVGLVAYVAIVVAVGLAPFFWVVFTRDVADVLPLIVIIPLIITLLVSLPYPALLSHQRRHDSARLLGGEAWAVWHYTPTERARISRAKLVEQDYKLSVVLGVSIFAAIIVFGMISIGRALDGIMLGGVLFGTVALVLIFFILPDVRMNRARKAAHANGMRQIAIGPTGICEDDVYIPLTLVGWGGRTRDMVHTPPPSANLGTPLLTTVILEPGRPAVLEFIRVYPRTGRRGLRNYYPGSYAARVRVAVPQGCEEEAAALVERFRDHLAWLPKDLVDFP